MKTVGLISRKGGSGKSTLATHWAVEAAQAGKKVVIIDMDPQGSSSRWYRRRKDADLILIQASADNLAERLGLCERESVDVVLLDTTPDIAREALVAIQRSDLVVIPCRPSVMDLEAISGTVSLCEREGKSAVVQINAAPSRTRDAHEAKIALGGYGVPISPVVIHDRVHIRRAPVDGRTARELSGSAKAINEISGSWSWVSSQLEGVQ